MKKAGKWYCSAEDHFPGRLIILQLGGGFIKLWNTKHYRYFKDRWLSLILIICICSTLSKAPQRLQRTTSQIVKYSYCFLQKECTLQSNSLEYTTRCSVEDNNIPSSDYWQIFSGEWVDKERTDSGGQWDLACFFAGCEYVFPGA